MPRALFLSHDNLADAFGRSEVLPYLTGLAQLGHAMTAVTFEDEVDESADPATTELGRSLADQGIRWLPLQSTKRPPALRTFVDMAKLKRHVLKLNRAGAFDVIHSRGHVGSIVGHDLARRLTARFVFDMRGFWPQERVEGGMWDVQKTLDRQVYKYVCNRQQQLLLTSNRVVVPTEAARKYIAEKYPWRAHALTVIPCAVDVGHVPGSHTADAAARRAELGLSSESTVVLYVGSVDSWSLLDEMLRWFKALHAAKRRDAHFLVLTPVSGHANVRHAAAAAGLAESTVSVRFAERAELAAWMAVGNVGLCFVQPSFSKIASCPTNVGEYLAAGMPVVGNAGVGDVAQLIGETHCGVALRTFDDAEVRRSIDQLLPLLHRPRESFRRVAAHRLNLRDAVAAYDDMYRQLTSSRMPAWAGGR